MPSLDEVRRLARDHSLVPLRHTFIADCETPVSAYLKLRGGAPVVPARVGRAGAAGRALVLPRLPAAQRDPHGRRPAHRRRRGARGGATRTRSWPRSSVAGARRRSRGCRRSPAARWACSATTSCARRSRPSAPAAPDDTGVPDLALMVSDVLVAFDHLRHEVTVLANVVADDDVERSYAEAAQTIADVRERLAAPVPRAHAGTARAGRVRVQPRRGGLRGRRRALRRSTSAPATPTRSCRASAGAPTARWRRSRSTAGCAP